MIRQCPLCGSQDAGRSKIILSDSKKEAPLRTCNKCGLYYLADLDRSRLGVYDENYSVWGEDEKGIEEVIAESKKHNFRKLLSKLRKHTSFRGKSILDIGTGNGYLLDAAKELGFRECWGLELSKSAAKKAAKKFPGRIFNCELGKIKTSKQFDVISMADVIEHLPSVKKDFELISRHLKKGGLLIITTPDTDSITRKMFSRSWFQYKFEHVVYFNRQSMERILGGYEILRFSNNTKSLKLAYYKSYFRKYVSKFLAGLMPGFLGGLTITNPMMGEMLVIARKK